MDAPETMKNLEQNTERLKPLCCSKKLLMQYHKAPKATSNSTQKFTKLRAKMRYACFTTRQLQGGRFTSSITY